MKTTPPFKNRAEAGRLLARKLSKHIGAHDVLVLGIPAGGVPVALEVAQALRAPMDVFVVYKIATEAAPSLSLGAVASGGVHVLCESLVASLHMPDEAISRVVQQAAEKVKARDDRLRSGRGIVDVRGKHVILVDDAMATGMSMRAAVGALRQLEPAAIVVAVPVGPTGKCEQLRKEADEVITLAEPEEFAAISHWYVEASPVREEEVMALLSRGATASAA